VREVTKRLVNVALFLIVLGLVETSREIVAMALIPLTFLLLPYGVKVKSVEVKRNEPQYVGELLEVEMKIECVGFGIAKFLHKLPESFELVEGRNAVTSFVFGRRRVFLRYEAKLNERGFYELDELLFESEHPLLISKKLKRLRIDLKLEVRHRFKRLVRVETVRVKTKSPVSDVDVSKIGVPSTDFKEIREYSYGDPVKFVNWKATARTGRLMVNRYETEGKKTVWIFLDANAYMGKLLDYAVELASALAYHFCSRGHKVGLHVIGGKYLYPDVGGRQFRRIFDELVRVDYGREDLMSALERVKRFLLIYKPFVFLITRVEYSKPRDFVSEIVKMGLKCQVLTLKGELECDELAKRVFELSRVTAKRRVMALDVDTTKPIYSVVARLVK